ncbi:MAG: hypothetical protein KDD15_04390 [Lewinella sp.]|nr:hypothetical protein [Lewinella sp.]
MELKNIAWLLCSCVLLLVYSQIQGQEYGANFNHNPEIIDFHYLERSKVEWIRTTPRILDYINGELDVETDPGLGKVVEAGEKGYKIAFGFRWDFKREHMSIPEPGSCEEKLLFVFATRILERVGPHTDIFKLGNEPNLETLDADMQPDESGEIPLVVFTERLLSEVVLPYYGRHPELSQPDIYVGSLPALFETRQQAIPGVNGLIQLAQNDDRITGLALHLHIADTSEIDRSFRYARQLMPDKPIIVPEWSLHRMYRKHLSETIGNNPAGVAFARNYRRDPNWKLYDWFTEANSNRISSEEWLALFRTRTWFPGHYMRIYAEKYRQYGVVLATFPLLQQSCPRQVNADSPAWFINPLFCQHSLELEEESDYSPNPLVFDDFLKLVQNGKSRKSPPAPLFIDPNYHGSCDPEVVWNASDQLWYIYYTARRPALENTWLQTPIGVVTSPDLIQWTFRGYCRFDGEGGKKDASATYWAPAIVAHEGKLHLFATFKEDTTTALGPWGGPGRIVHYETPLNDPVNGWKIVANLHDTTLNTIDATVYRQEGLFHLWFKGRKKSAKQDQLYHLTSKDLYHWEPAELVPSDVFNSSATGSDFEEAPYVFEWHGRHWLITDPHLGLFVYSSDDGSKWNFQGTMLREGGKRALDNNMARHCSVALVGDRAFIFYHVEPWRRYDLEQKKGKERVRIFQQPLKNRRSVLQIAELKIVDGKLICDRDQLIELPTTEQN